MEQIDIPPFYVSQEVVANCNHPDGVFKKGDEFKVHSISKNTCCGIWVITIGIMTDRSKRPYQDCICGRENFIGYGELTFSAKRFSPKITLAEFISMKQLVEEQLELTSVN